MKKTLLILRHAKSSWKEPGLADHDRPLNKRGRRDAPRIGELVRARSLVPDLILSSTAVRARTTAEMVAEACGYSHAIELSRELYGAGPEACVQALRDLYYDDDRVLLVGHNPGIGQLATALTGDGDPDARAALEQGYPTGALASLSLDGSWYELGPGQATITAFVRPRMLE
jgi:phosphohistidine phosphatase